MFTSAFAEFTVLEKSPAALQLRGHGRGEVALRPLAQPLEITEEECPIVAVVELRNHHRTTRRRAELVALEIGPRQAALVGEIAIGVQFRVPQEFVHRAVQLIGARLEYDVDNSATGPPELGRVAVGLHLELLHRVHRRVHRKALDRIHQRR